MATTPDAATLTDWYKTYTAKSPAPMPGTAAPAAPAAPAAAPAAPPAPGGMLSSSLPGAAPAATGAMLSTTGAVTTAAAPGPAAASPAPATPSAPQWTPDANATVQGRLKGILEEGSPLLTQAETAAKQQTNARGLLNSSIGVTAGQDALYRAALPIAQQDAATFAQAGQQKAAFEQQTAERTATQTFQATQQEVQNTFAARQQELQEKGMDSRQAAQLAQQEALTKLQEAGVNNRFDAQQALQSKQFNVEQAAADRRLAQQHSNELARLGFVNELNKENVPSAFAAQVSQETASAVNAILADPNISPEDKKGAIQNAVDYGNSRMRWGETFYKTVFPDLSAPTSAVPPAAAPGAAPAAAPTSPRAEMDRIAAENGGVVPGNYFNP